MLGFPRWKVTWFLVLSTSHLITNPKTLDDKCLYCLSFLLFGFQLLAAKKHPNQYINNPTVRKLVGYLINLAQPLLTVRHGSITTLANFILLATVKKRCYCFIHFLDEELSYREVKSLIWYYRTNQWQNQYYKDRQSGPKIQVLTQDVRVPLRLTNRSWATPIQSQLLATIKNSKGEVRPTKFSLPFQLNSLHSISPTSPKFLTISPLCPPPRANLCSDPASP